MSEPTVDSEENSHFADIEFTNKTKRNPEIDRRIDILTSKLSSKGVEINPFITNYFRDPHFFYALPSWVQDDGQLLLEYIENTGKFDEIIGAERERRFKGEMSGLFGEIVSLPETEHLDGRTRRSENGYRINIGYLNKIDIDPKKVLFFRITQPIPDQPKPEYYWTSDYNEVVYGLNNEIPSDQRKTSIVLIADLQTIDENGGLIQDINDDNGLAVRQIGNGPFDQHKALAQITDIYDKRS